MLGLSSLRIVVDTNVVFEGLTKQGGASGLIIDAWLARLMVVCISNALAYEYTNVLPRCALQQAQAVSREQQEGWEGADA